MRRDVFEIDGVSTPVVSAGPADDPEAVVCLHGNPGSSADWLDLMPRVAPFARVVAPDMPGFGRAGKSERFNYTVPGYAAHLDALLRRLAISRVHLLLHDFGGAWGLEWALAHSNALASLTLVNVGVMPGYRWHIAARVWRTPWLGELAMAMVSQDGFSKAMQRTNPRGLPMAFVDGMYKHFDRGTKRAVLKLYRATNDMGVFAQRAEAFREMAIPVCVVWGAADPYVAVKYANEQKDFFPAAEVHVFDDSGHWPHQDNSERFAGAVVPFLRRARAGG